MNESVMIFLVEVLDFIDQGERTGNNERILPRSGVSKAFVGVQALKNVDLRIRLGETHCLAGENGCGKSTLIKIISGSIQLTKVKSLLMEPHTQNLRHVSL